MLRVLFIGDIVGKSGRNALFEHLPFLLDKYHYDFLIVNGENAAHGKGITKKIYDQFVDAGINCITMGNHTFSKDMIFSFIDQADIMVRPANIEPEDFGKPARIFNVKGKKIGVFNLSGNVFMNNTTDNCFDSFKNLIKGYPCDIRIVDLHAEATSEKIAFMKYFKNNCSLIVGTHTHVQTADESIWDGCGFISDVGMTGPYDSVLGRDNQEVLELFADGKKTKYTISDNPAIICGVLCDIDLSNNRCVHIERIQIRPNIEK